MTSLTLVDLQRQIECHLDHYVKSCWILVNKIILPKLYESDVRSEQLSSKESESLAPSLTKGPPGASEIKVNKFLVSIWNHKRRSSPGQLQPTVLTVRSFSNEMKDSIVERHSANAAAETFEMPSLIQSMHNVLKINCFRCFDYWKLTPIIFSPHFEQE